MRLETFEPAANASADCPVPHRVTTLTNLAPSGDGYEQGFYNATDERTNASVCFYFGVSSRHFVLEEGNDGQCPDKAARPACKRNMVTGGYYNILASDFAPSALPPSSNYQGVIWVPATQGGGGAVTHATSCAARGSCNQNKVATLASADWDAKGQTFSVSLQETTTVDGCSVPATKLNFIHVALRFHAEANIFLATLIEDDKTGAGNNNNVTHTPACFYFEVSSGTRSGNFALVLDGKGSCPDGHSMAQRQPSCQEVASTTAAVNTTTIGRFSDVTQGVAKVMPSGVWSGSVTLAHRDSATGQCDNCTDSSLSHVKWSPDMTGGGGGGGGGSTMSVTVFTNATSCKAAPISYTVTDLTPYKWPASDYFFRGMTSDAFAEGGVNVPICVYFDSVTGVIVTHFDGQASCAADPKAAQATCKPISSTAAVQQQKQLKQQQLIEATYVGVLDASNLAGVNGTWIGAAVPPSFSKHGASDWTCGKCSSSKGLANNPFRVPVVVDWDATNHTMTVSYAAGKDFTSNCSTPAQTYQVMDIFKYGKSRHNYYTGKISPDGLNPIPICFYFDTVNGRFVLELDQDAGATCPAVPDFTTCSSSVQHWSGYTGKNQTTQCLCEIYGPPPPKPVPSNHSGGGGGGGNSSSNNSSGHNGSHPHPHPAPPPTPPPPAVPVPFLRFMVDQPCSGCSSAQCMQDPTYYYCPYKKCSAKAICPWDTTTTTTTSTTTTTAGPEPSVNGFPIKYIIIAAVGGGILLIGGFVYWRYRLHRRRAGAGYQSIQETPQGDTVNARYGSY